MASTSAEPAGKDGVAPKKMLSLKPSLLYRITNSGFVKGETPYASLLREQGRMDMYGDAELSVYTASSDAYDSASDFTTAAYSSAAEYTDIDYSAVNPVEGDTFRDTLEDVLLRFGEEYYEFGLTDVVTDGYITATAAQRGELSEDMNAKIDRLTEVLDGDILRPWCDHHGTNVEVVSFGQILNDGNTKICVLRTSKSWYCFVFHTS